MRMCSALIFLFLIQILFCFSGYADEIHNEAKKRLSVSVSNKKKDNPVLVVALNFLFTPQVVAQDFWDTIGPFGGTVYSLAINADGHIFAGTNGGGIFRSTDNSESWTEVATLSAGFSTGHIRSLATSPNGDIFAGFESLFDAGRVFRSIDNGDSWTKVNTGLINLYVRSLAISQKGYIFAGTGRGVSRSLSPTGIILEPEIAVRPSSHDFGDVVLGDSSEVIFTIRNTGSDTLAITNSSSSDPQQFFVSHTAFIIVPTDSQLVTVVFKPKSEGLQEAILTIDSVHKEGLGAGSNHREQQILEFHPQFF